MDRKVQEHEVMAAVSKPEANLVTKINNSPQKRKNFNNRYRSSLCCCLAEPNGGGGGGCWAEERGELWVYDAWPEHMHVTALGGAAMGELRRFRKRDVSHFPTAQATALSQRRDRGRHSPPKIQQPVGQGEGREDVVSS